MSTSSRDARSITIRLPRRLVAGLVMTVAALGLVGVGVAGGSRLAEPTSVAVVNYSQVVSNLEQWTAMEAEQAQMRSSMTEEGSAMVARFEELVEQIRGYEAQAQAAGGELDEATLAEAAAVQDEARKLDLRIEAFKQRSSRRLDWEQSYALEEIWQVVNTEIQTIADANGYDIVMADDSGDALQVNRRQANASGQLAAQMGQRRLLYTARSVDITQDLIDRLNNAWKAAR